MGISAYKLSKSIGVQQTRISLIIKGERGITADIATRLSKYFGTSPEFWMNLQRVYDMRKVNSELKEIIDNTSVQNDLKKVPMYSPRSWG